MNQKKQLSSDDINHVAKLANLPLSESELNKYSSQLSSIIDLIDQIQKLPTENEQTTSQVTGLKNVFRPDEIDTSRLLTQEQALKNASKTHNGYFVVPKIL